MEDSIFTKIIKGEIPCHKIYEDDLTLAFLDIHPTTLGHTLVVPKSQVNQLWDLPAADYQAVMETCKKVAKRMQDVLEPKRVGMHLIGFDVPHAHVHVFPINTSEDYWRQPNMSADPDNTALTEAAKKLAF